MPENADYPQFWETLFASRSWGRYPPEDLVRFVARNFGKKDRSSVKILEMGCGPGANLWFLHREGYHTFGIDFSATAISQAKDRIAKENAQYDVPSPELEVGNFASLPWQDNSFDAVIDIYGICANTLSVIDDTLSEVCRVLKPGGLFYSKQWGQNCTGFGEGEELEPGTFKDIPKGPCANSGVIHFFKPEEIADRFAPLQVRSVDVMTTHASADDCITEELLCLLQKSAD